ncbi:MAG TPA: M20/M25/M40 family metallo-hydrolase [Acidobacteriota bacterium]|nr:M20/M25/M40 family metallo-hydrolase [Acidobacteriota bacterium]
MGIDSEFLRKTLIELVRINSINPKLVEGAPGEAAAAAFVAERLEEIGCQVHWVEETPGRPSVVGISEGLSPGRRLMWNAHLDTVGAEGMPEPFRPQVRNGRLYGRGAFDMKGSLAACLAALKALHETGVRFDGTILLTAVADEEFASLGTQQVLERFHSDAAVAAEPTQLKICLAHKGFIWSRIGTFGKAAHGSRHGEGIDANRKMGRVLVALDELNRRLASKKPHPFLGNASLHAALLTGGTGLSTYAAHAEVQVERRTLPGETAESVEAEYRSMLRLLSDGDPEFRADLEHFFVRAPFEVSRDAGIVKDLFLALQSVTGNPPEFSGEGPWTDAALLTAAGIETVVFGPSGNGAHSDLEWVELDSLATMAQALFKMVVGSSEA